MMHGAEKSDPVIVAGKPANKAEQPLAARVAGEPNAAERVERRVGTKGNAGQQSRRRTQCRASLSQELERIRQVARERKKERFTALLHHISIERLEAAFFELKKDAAPWGGSADVEGLRGRLRAPYRGLAPSGPPGSVSGTAQSAPIHTKSRWATAPDCDLRSGRQNRPEGDCRGAKRDLRGRFSWFLVWISSQAQPARRAGCVNSRDHHHKGELYIRSRHQKLLGCRFIMPPNS